MPRGHLGITAKRPQSTSQSAETSWNVRYMVFTRACAVDKSPRCPHTASMVIKLGIRQRALNPNPTSASISAVAATYDRGGVFQHPAYQSCRCTRLIHNRVLRLCMQRLQHLDNKKDPRFIMRTSPFSSQDLHSTFYTQKF